MKKINTTKASTAVFINVIVLSETLRLSRWPPIKRSKARMVAEHHPVRNGNFTCRRQHSFRFAVRRVKALGHLDFYQSMLNRQIPLNREVIRRDQLDNFGNLGAQGTLSSRAQRVPNLPDPEKYDVNALYVSGIQT